MNRSWLVTLRDGVTVDVTADDMLLEGGILRFGDIIEIPEPAFHDTVLFNAGTWARVQGVDAAVVFHDPPTPEPPPITQGFV